METRSRYSMLVEWSDVDNVYVVTLPEWGSYAHTHGATYEEAATHGREVIESLTAIALEDGKPLPEPRMFGATDVAEIGSRG